MTTRSTGPAGGTDGPTQPRGLRRVVFGALVGTALEWYDFFIYGTAAALVFNVLFFPQSDPAVGTITAFATFGVGFVFRPLGGIIFGHIGDRIGRRATLILTTLVMGLSTGVIGLLPTYDTIGVWAPVLLVLLRVLQGLGAGAEFGGASTLLAEHAPPHRRGYYCSFAQLGVQVGLVLATVSFLLVGLLPEEQLLAWGWRVPFLVSFLMIGVALYVRLRVEESPVFRAMAAEQTIIKLPVLETLRTYPRNLLIGVGAHIADTACAYLYATFTVAYATSTLGISRGTVLTGVIIFGLVVIVLQPVYGALSDRIGRKPLNLFSMAFTAVFIWPFFLLLQTEQPVLVVLALVIATAFGWAPVIAVQPAFYAELFGARVRYSGFATSREVGAALAGFTPLIAAALVAAAGGAPWVVAAYIAGLCVISLIAFLAAPELKDMDIAEAGPTQLRANR
ncbi:MHS family shikimate/dehydroshikimate transporter-like MFS transporter [Pseudonocardia hierapolitana]|uniref:Putative proline/betaine transporter n=1 Tax=Pseudonocardia hierapolitana TaxID=1128676 RepID=A0A561T5N4_9PSEU|nr:MFS transporter [Pseudonocardia hierapolitana]TWF82422.1 MHS family shikimate/dehydroshikimate transporter-like MFS transporter [Pseudonocardia hierapolitana]